MMTLLLTNILNILNITKVSLAAKPPNTQKVQLPVNINLHFCLCSVGTPGSICCLLWGRCFPPAQDMLAYWDPAHSSSKNELMCNIDDENTPAVILGSPLTRIKYHTRQEEFDLPAHPGERHIPWATVDLGWHIGGQPGWDWLHSSGPQGSQPLVLQKELWYGY